MTKKGRPPKHEIEPIPASFNEVLGAIARSNKPTQGQRKKKAKKARK